MNISLAKAEDLIPLLEMKAKLIEEEQSTMKEPYPVIDITNDTKLGIAQMFLAQLQSADDVVLVAKDRGEVIGAIHGGIRFRVFGRPSYYFIVDDLIVVPEKRKAGVARSMGEELFKWKRDWEARTGIEVPIQEMEAVASERQISRWTSKGWKIYSVKLWKESY